MKTVPSIWFIINSRLKGKNFLYEFYFRNKKTLDVGCGNGEFMHLDKASIHGVDLNKEAVEKLRQEGFSVKLAGVDSLPYQSGEFDMIHCRNVIEHLTPSVACEMIRESARVLKAGGLLLLCSEVMTDKFWGTFGHTRPYPPGAIKKLLRDKTREEFSPITTLEYVDTFYLGDYSPHKLVYLISTILGYFTSLSRREYFLVLRKK